MPLIDFEGYLNYLKPFITARRYASAVYVVAMRLSVRPSGTSRNSIKTAKQIISHHANNMAWQLRDSSFLVSKVLVKFQ